MTSHIARYFIGLTTAALLATGCVEGKLHINNEADEDSAPSGPMTDPAQSDVPGLPNAPVPDPEDPTGPDAGGVAADVGVEEGDAPIDPVVASSDPLEGLPSGLQQWQALCAKGYADTVTEAFCAGAAPPTINSLADLRSLLGLELVPGESLSGANGNPGFAVVSHSTAIGIRKVNELNPRVIIFTPPRGQRNATNLQPNPTWNILAFSRGEPFVELASKDAVTGEPRFFLVRFEHPCEQQPNGCSNWDRYSETIEDDWTGYTVYDDDAIRNTTLDCLQCHQPDGPGTPKMLRMQETSLYWNHWFFNESPAQDRVRADFGAAHAGETHYGGLPMQAFTGIRLSHPGHFEAFLQHNGQDNQPNAFHSIQIDRELANQGTSPTWDALYAESVAGREIATPHWKTSPSDPGLLQQMIDAYQDVLNGAASPDTLPDITQTIPESEWADMSIRPKDGLDGRGIMNHMCRHCHNSTLDQGISRASFNVDQLDALPRDVKDLAIERLLLPDEDRRKMPPPRFHELTDAQRDLVIQELLQ